MTENALSCPDCGVKLRGTLADPPHLPDCNWIGGAALRRAQDLEAVAAALRTGDMVAMNSIYDYIFGGGVGPIAPMGRR